MNAKDLARHDGSDREGVEHVDKRLPSLDVGPSFTFVVESVDCEGAPQDRDEDQKQPSRGNLTTTRLWAPQDSSDSPRVTFAHS